MTALRIAFRYVRAPVADSGGFCGDVNRHWPADGYNHGYTSAMKTAISIPDAIFEEAERLAKNRGWSRSELYSNAVSAYVNSERFLGVREKLDAVYGPNVVDSAVDPLLATAQARSLPKEKW
jgi:antitoxin MazE6